jgi:YD repeat-containing protein
VIERNVYDTYGNVIASYDRNGNQTLYFYDAKDRRIATVDALGYLTQWNYDQQGNVIEQRQYAQALDPSTLSPSVLPTAPAGDVAVTDIQYDAASRRVKEISPQISTFDPTSQTTTVIRPTATYTFDKVGNQLTKTLGSGTAQATTEYSYFDADNRRVAVVNSGRALATYAFDANGNVLAQKRYFTTVDAGVDLTQLSGSTNFAALVSASPGKDEETDFSYDALNRQTTQSDLLAGGTLTKQTGYDAVSNHTYSKDEDGFITRASYDAMGRLAESISPDGSGTLYQYDAAGNRILAYTGVVTGGPPAAASGIAAILGAQVSLSWGTQGTPQQPIQTWVVYDTASHQSISDYANRTATQVSSNGHGQASLASAASGSTVYFRVVTQDGAGNQTWTAEQSLTIPPRFTSLSVAQPSADTLVVTANFDAGVTNAQLLYGAGSSLTQSAAFVLQANGTYQATLTGLSNPAALSFAIHWQDGSGNAYSSATGTFAAAAGQVGVTTTVNQTQIVNGANTSYTLAVGLKVPAGFAAGLTSVQAQWRVVGSTNAFASSAVTGTDSGQGFTTYSAVLGDTNNLAAGTYEIVITGVRADGTSVELDHFNYTTGPTATSLTRNAVSWALPAVGNDQFVIIDGQNAASLRDNGRVVVTDASTSTSAGYAAFYGQDFADTHTVNVSSAANTTSGYDVTVQAALSAGEVANIGSGGLHLAWRPAGTGTGFANDVALSSSGTNSYSTQLSGLAAGQYDIEVYYVDSSGHQVVVEWRRADAATVNTAFNGHSLTVLAQESGGSIATSAQGIITVSPGLYTGSRDITALSSSLSLTLTGTGNVGGSLQTDGRATGYFTETQYNALGYKIASNEGDGLWRQYRVDANGNAVQTDLLGDRTNPNYNPNAPITTYTAYDARNRKIADFAAPVLVSGSSTLTRPITHYSYDFQDKVTAKTDALGKTTQYAYNLLGSEIQLTDPYGATTQTLIDQFGNVTAQVSQLGHRSLKFYDLQGRLISEQDAVGNTTSYTYDTFDRRLTQTDAMGNQTSYAYDQRDRLISQTDPLNNSATFAYDGRNNRISTLYPLSQRTDQVYDGLGRVVDTQVYLNGQATHSRTAYDAYGNVISESDAMGRTKTHVYGAFGRLLQDIDEDGNIIAYGYDVYGHRTNDYNPNGVSNPSAATDPSGAKDIQKTYDQAGRLTAITDLATGVSTSYTYDLSGRRLTEVITTPGNAHNRNITYQYDALGQMVRWADSVTGDHLNRQFDAEGNLVREYTDSGYDPLGQNTSANPNYRYVDHVYSYYAGQVSDAVINAYTYDAASNRATWNNAGTIVTYTYDADGRAREGDYTSGGDSNSQAWTYDAMGNVLTYTTSKNGNQTSSTVNTYNDANRVLTGNKDGDVTTNTYDATLRITQTVLQNKGKTFTYDYSYYGDGREKSVKAFGDANGNSISTYDVNKVRSRVDLGQGDGQNRPEFKSFVADNEGHILFELHDDGKSSQNGTREFLYANGAPVAETAVGTDGKLTVLLDSASYAPIQNLSDTNPGNNLSYTIRDGDTLQGIALQMYGNASLWFVIAEANGLSAGATLKAGTQILIPNTVQNGTITADNHKVYSEGDIVGSTLPNLKSPPPPSHGGCGSILAIIIVVVIAIVVAVVTAGIGGALVASLGISTTTTGGLIAAAAVYAVAGAVVAAIGSIVQQGLFIALGYQEKFSWKQVAGAAVSGALSGAAAGLGAGAQLAAQAGKLTEVAAEYVKVASALLKVASVASQQLIENGKITSWTSLAAAGVGGYAQAAGSISAGANATNSLSSAAFKASATSALGTASQVSTVANYVTPWVQLAETSIRNGKLTPSDWAGAVGATLSQAVDDHLAIKPKEGQTLTLGQRLINSSLQLGTQSLVAGALSAVDRNAAQSYFENSVGHEAGQFIGQTLAQPIQGYFGDLTKRIEAKNATNQPAADASAKAAANAAPPPAGSGTGTVDQADGVVKDQNANPTAPADTQQNTASAEQAAQDTAATPPAPQSYAVQKGDSYARIARIVYGDERYAALIMQANGVDPTYGNVHGLQIGTDLTLPDISNLGSGDTAAVLRVGGRLLGADQKITDQLAAQQSQQSTDQAQEAGTSGTPPTPTAPAPSAVAAQGKTDNGVLAQGRATVNDYWGHLQDQAVEEGSFLKYAGAGLMRFLGNVGYTAADTAVAMYNDPESTLKGAGKEIVNFGPELANGAINLTKTAANGLTLLAEQTPLVSQGTFEGFRQTDPYNIQLLLPYSNQAEQGGALVASLALGYGIAKFGELPVLGEAAKSDALVADTAASKGLAGGAQTAPGDTVTVYRVEGAGNQRIVVGGNGSVNVPEVLTRSGSERNLFLNFGDEARAQEFLQQRLAQFPDSTIKTFEVPQSFVDELRSSAVPEADRSLFPDRPVIADPTKAVDQFGLSKQQIEQLRRAIVQGSGNAIVP